MFQFRNNSQFSLPYTVCIFYTPISFPFVYFFRCICTYTARTFIYIYFFSFCRFAFCCSCCRLPLHTMWHFHCALCFLCCFVKYSKNYSNARVEIRDFFCTKKMCVFFSLSVSLLLFLIALSTNCLDFIFDCAVAVCLCECELETLLSTNTCLHSHIRQTSRMRFARSPA